MAATANSLLIEDARWLLELRYVDVALLDAVLHSRGYSDDLIGQIVSIIDTIVTPEQLASIIHRITNV